MSRLSRSSPGRTKNESQPVEHYDGTLGVSRAFVAAHQGPVGQLQWNDDLARRYAYPGNVSGRVWGSGTLVATDLFLTAAHCFAAAGGWWVRPRTDDAPLAPGELARNLHVTFNYQLDSAGELRATQAYPIVELVAYRPGELDVAMVRLGGNPGATWGVAELAATGARPGEQLCIIGHPLGFTKRIDAGRCVAVAGSTIHHDLDTFEGSSGSGILRASDGRLVGVHTHGAGAAAANTGVCITALSRAVAAGGTAARPCSAPRWPRSP